MALNRPGTARTVGFGRVVVSEIKVPNKYVSASGVKWMGGGTKRQCDRALPPQQRRVPAPAQQQRPLHRPPGRLGLYPVVTSQYPVQHNLFIPGFRSYLVAVFF
jgi:hypothetical protein